MIPVKAIRVAVRFIIKKVVTQMTKRPFLIPEDPVSNPVIDNFR